MSRYTRKPSRPERKHGSVIPSRNLLKGINSFPRFSIGTIVHPDRPCIEMAELLEFKHVSQAEDKLTEYERRAEEILGEADIGWRSCWVLPPRASSLDSLFETPTDVDFKRRLFTVGGEWNLLSGEEITVDPIHTDGVSRNKRCLNRIAFARVYITPAQ